MGDARVLLYLAAMITSAFAALMIGAGESAKSTAATITHYLGPAFSVIFALIAVWGVVALGWLRRGLRARAEAHMRLVVTQAREMGLVGTFVGILVLLAPLSTVAPGGPEGIAAAMPGIIDGLGLALGTTLAGRFIANAFLVVWTLAAGRTDEGDPAPAPAAHPAWRRAEG